MIQTARRDLKVCRPDLFASLFRARFSRTKVVPDADHNAKSSCLACPESVFRRRDPRYLLPNKDAPKSSESVKASAPARLKALKRKASDSPSRGSSAGRSFQTRDSDTSSVLEADQAASLMSSFRKSVLQLQLECSITKQGTWVTNAPGPAIEVAHIVPQVHWHTYPTAAGDVPHPDNNDDLSSAWLRTFSCVFARLLTNF
jgi:hypothetical protein